MLTPMQYPSRPDAVGTSGDTQIIQGAKRFAGNLRVGGVDAATSRLHITGLGTSTGEALKVEDSANSAKLIVLDNGRLAINGATATNGWVTLKPGGSGAALTVRDTSDASSVFLVSDAGVVGVNAALSSSTQMSIIRNPTNASSNVQSLTSSATLSDGGTYTFNGLSLSHTTTQTSLTSASGSFGINVANRITVASTLTNSGSNIGLYVDSKITGSAHAGTVSSLSGIQVDVGLGTGATGGGTITNPRGIVISLDRRGTGSIGDFRAISISETGTATTTTTRYGMYETMATGTVNYFANVLGIGSPTGVTSNLVINRANTQAAWGASGINFRTVAATHTDSSTADAATVTAAHINSFERGTVAATNASSGITYRHSATLYIQREPIAGTNVTINNQWALMVDSGATQLRNVFVGAGDYVSNSKFANNTLLNGSGYAGIQIRSSTTATLPALEMFTNSDAISDGGVTGRISFWLGVTTTREGARIETQAVGTSENATRIVISTMTAGTLTERVRINATGEVGIGVAASAGNILQVKGAGTTTGIALLVENSASTASFTIRDDGAFAFRGGTVATAQTGYADSGTNYAATRTSSFDFSTMTASDANIRTLALMVETLKRDLKAKGIVSA